MRRIREALWQEAGCDLNRLGELARQGAAKIPNLGPPINNAEELRHYINQQETAALELGEKSPPYGPDSTGKP